MSGVQLWGIEETCAVYPSLGAPPSFHLQGGGGGSFFFFFETVHLSFSGTTRFRRLLVGDDSPSVSKSPQLTRLLDQTAECIV